MPTLSWYVDMTEPAAAAAVRALRATLDGAGWRDAGDVTSRWAGAADALVVWADRPLPEAFVAALLTGGRPLVLAGPTLERADPDGLLADAAGVLPGPATPRHDVRVRAGDVPALAARLTDHAHTGLAHLGEHVHVEDHVLTLDKVADDVQVLLAAQVGLARQPLATWRPATRVLSWTIGRDAESVAAPAVVRLLVLALRHALGLGTPGPVRVGLLGFGAIGHEHARAVRAVEGLELAAVCDRSPDRVAAATAHAPQLRGYADPDAMLADDGVDLVVVSTAPDTHAEWVLRALDAGRHVVVEKPFAVEPVDADQMLAAAEDRGRLVVVYQNRRFDPDHLAIRRLVRAGALGDVFHVETFVGGYGHPCNLWHSDAAVSGGAAYDWGAHVVDQLLDLLPGPVEHVTAAAYKGVWHDVTNADHTRLTLRWRDGAEAEFVCSDVAAALKPRWYVLGTGGAVVGHWRVERVVARSDIGTLVEDPLAPADSPPALHLHDPDGSVTRLATPPPPPHPFHRELADRLLLGLPMSVTAEQSRRVVGVLAAARESAADGGRPVAPA